ncbi:contact-dependent growth inhibition system immunity protein [Curtobacterium sp. VKM Ac-2922]|uniref:contact-dependent growth inhibition system immunity protein n=1 Tax=Curtobacterium sp. VKM Ac-2922 TaxID=2929475 RepID=UPI001FB356E5|nr:contact-dependent growth inhibition system immunity protein [Curtobacterium sp. VKM Ac-2922]MCJ1715741.1 contact-dependent growth inhibition system immunity protein [Curtobacterium sp. VKM Ac-2922]
MTTSSERLREIRRLAPHIDDSLAADFNVVLRWIPGGEPPYRVITSYPKATVGGVNDLERRALIAKIPHLRNLLAAVFNYDWDLDYEDAEAAYASVFDDLDADARVEYIREAQLLERELTSETEVQEFLNFVGSGLAPSEDLGVSLAEWPRALVRRIRKSMEQ